MKVSSLSEFFGVSEITIWRDPEHLEREGLLEQTHGGAIYSRRMWLEPLYMEKYRICQEEKRQIRAAAAAVMEGGETLLIKPGSTSLQIFRYLAGRKNLRVISSNMGAILETQGPDLELILIRGIYREQSNSLVRSTGHAQPTAGPY